MILILKKSKEKKNRCPSDFVTLPEEDEDQPTNYVTRPEPPERIYMSEEDYYQRRRSILDEYKGQFKTRKYKSALDDDLVKNELNLVEAPINSKFRAFQKRKFEIERDESYALEENGKELRAQDLEELNDSFYEAMKAQYGDDPRVMDRVMSVMGARYIESPETKQRQLTEQATALFDSKEDDIEAAIGTTIEEMAGLQEDGPSLGYSYPNLESFVEDVLTKAGIDDTIFESERLQEVFLI